MALCGGQPVGVPPGKPPKQMASTLNGPGCQRRVHAPCTDCLIMTVMLVLLQHVSASPRAVLLLQSFIIKPHDKLTPFSCGHPLLLPVSMWIT